MKDWQLVLSDDGLGVNCALQRWHSVLGDDDAPAGAAVDVGGQGAGRVGLVELAPFSR
jgi:hypothetical protein